MKSYISVIISAAIVSLLGFINDMVLSFKYGTSIISDAYIISKTLEMVIFTGISNTIHTCFISIYTSIKKEEKNKFISNCLNIFTILVFIIIVIIVFFNENIVRIIAGSKNIELLRNSQKIFKYYIWCGIFAVNVGILKGYLYTKGKFLSAGLSIIPVSICSIIGIIFSSEERLEILGIAPLIGYIISYIYIYIKSRKNKFSHDISFNIKYNNFKQLIVLIIPMFIGEIANQVNVLIDKRLAANLDNGIVSSLTYANKINTLVVAMLITTMGSYIYPTLCKTINKKDVIKYKEKVKNSLIISILIVIPLAIILILHSSSIISLVFERGAFNKKDTIITAQSLSWYSIGLVFLAINNILKKAFLAEKDSKTPVVISLVSIVVNIILNIYLVSKIGYIGIPIATSISTILASTLLYVIFSIKNNGLNIINEIVKIIIPISSFIIITMVSKVIIVGGNYDLLFQIIIIFIAGLVGFGVYIFIILKSNLELLKGIEIKNICNKDDRV